MSTTPAHRILAVEIRAARLGYAVLETPKQLRDFGAAWFDSPAAARARIIRLLGLYRPRVLVLRGASPRYPLNKRNRRPVARIAHNEARRLAIPVAHISELAFGSCFERYACRDKYDVAAVLAAAFPDLASRLPARPKFYDPEPRPILYFDSIALGIAYLELNRENSLETSKAIESFRRPPSGVAKS